MFGFEPAAKPAETQQVVEAEYSTSPEKTILETTEGEQLTMAEREAVPPSAPTMREQVEEIASAPVEPRLTAMAPVEKAPMVEQAKASPAVPAAKPEEAEVPGRMLAKAPPRKVKTTPPVQRRPVETPVKTAAKVPQRLHPDDLPGAVLSSHPSLVVTQDLVNRPSRSQASTPYGQAEESYLDGKWALAQARNGLAVRSLQHALELYPGHLPARELLADLLIEAGKSAEAMSLLAGGLDIAPDYTVFKKKYARLLVEAGDEDAATKVLLNGGLPTVEEDPETHVMLASLYQKLGEPFLAAQTYRNLLVAWPQTGAFWVGLGGALESQRLPEEALICYQQALKTNNLRQDLSKYAQSRLSALK